VSDDDESRRRRWFVDAADCPREQRPASARHDQFRDPANKPRPRPAQIYQNSS